MDKPLRSAIELTPNNADNFVLVTTSIDRYFRRDMAAIGNVQRLFPRHTITFYDLEEKNSSANITKVKPQSRLMLMRIVRTQVAYRW